MARARAVGWWAAVVALYLGLAWLSTTVAVLDTLTVWYAPAGLALAWGALHGWRALPALATGEVLVGLLLFGVAGDFGWLVVPNGIAYAAVYVVAGRAAHRAGVDDQDPLRRRAVRLVLIAVTATLAAAAVGIGFQLLAGVTSLQDAPRDLFVWWLGDTVGVVGVTATVLSIAIRGRRGGRWWALPEVEVIESWLLVLAPALLTVAVAVLTNGVAPFAAAVFVPTLVLAQRGGPAGVALAAPLTTLAMSVIADARFETDVLGLVDLQLVLLLVLLSGFGAAVAAEQRNELRERLRLRERHLARAQQQARSGSFVWNVPDDQVVWSDGLYALFGTEHRPVTAADYIERVHEDDRVRVGETIASVLATGEAADHRYRVVRPDGQELVLRARIEPRCYDGRVVELLGTCTDVTREDGTARRLADAVEAERRAVEAERAAGLATARAERVKDALLVAVSHEVRTPLTIVRGLVDTLRRPELADAALGDQTELLGRLDRHTTRLQAVLRDLLDVDRIGRGVVEPIRRPCDLTVLAEDVLGHVNHLERPVLLDLPPGELLLDARLVARIIEALLANALRHGDPGTPIRVTGRIEAGRLELRVEDRGPGVPHEDRDRVFGAFEHGQPDEPSPGSGVGLFLVARFAELHGGRAWVTDAPDGGGASFRVSLPLPTPVAPDAA